MVAFSFNIPAYVLGRPFYPLPFYKEALERTPVPLPGETLHIWDCATGPNAAVTLGLVEVLSASRFTNVPVLIHATDANAEIVASAQQHFNDQFRDLKALPKNIKVDFKKAAAEVGPPSLPLNEKMSLVMVGNALHWFDRPRFYKTVHKLSKNDGLLVAWTHKIEPRVPEFSSIQEKIAGLCKHLHKLEVAASKDFVTHGYRNLLFPFAEEIKFAPHIIIKFMTIKTLGYYFDSHFPRKNKATFGNTLFRITKSEWSDHRCPKRFEWPMDIRAVRIGSYAPHSLA
jgi:hypothetical protein